MQEPWNWTRDDLESLIGQSETLRLDFKRSNVLQQPINQIAENLSKEISAFANTEGGTIVIGIKERREGRARVADQIDEGTNIEDWSPERLQQFIESHVSPYLTGIRVRPICINNEKRTYVFVIHVPQGSTAYQAKDHRYYGRSEYESKSLPDYEVRLRMARGKTPRAALHIAEWSSRNLEVGAKNKHPGLDRQLEYFQDELSKLNPDAKLDLIEYYFKVILENTGEINLTEFKVAASFVPTHRFKLDQIKKSYKDGWHEWFGYGPISTNDPGRPMRVNIYPGDRFEIEQRAIVLRPGEYFDDDNLIMNWTLYLTNTLPIQGQLGIAQEFRRWKAPSESLSSEG